MQEGSRPARRRPGAGGPAVPGPNGPRERPRVDPHLPHVPALLRRPPDAARGGGARAPRGARDLDPGPVPGRRGPRARAADRGRLRRRRAPDRPRGRDRARRAVRVGLGDPRAPDLAGHEQGAAVPPARGRYRARGARPRPVAAVDGRPLPAAVRAGRPGAGPNAPAPRGGGHDQGLRRPGRRTDLGPPGGGGVRATMVAVAENVLPLRVMLVDDHEVVRGGVRALLQATDDIIVTAEAGTVREAVDEADRARPDVVVMDVRLADGSGIEATREIRARHPNTKVVMLTSFADDEALFASIMAGASGYVLKQVRGGELVRAIRTVGKGG